MTALPVGKRPKLVWCGCLAVLLLASACTQRTPPDTRADNESAIRELDALWSKTAGIKDLEGTIAYYSDDASLLPPNAPIATGKQAIRAAWAPMLAPGTSLSWQANKVEAAHSADLAYITGTYQMSMTDAQGKPATDQGKFVEVWKKQTDGKWKVVADIFNSDLPATPPAPAEEKQD